MLLSDGTVYLARSEAACAYGSFSYSAVIVDPYGLDVGVPFSFCMDIGVRNSISRCVKNGDSECVELDRDSVAGDDGGRIKPVD